MKYKITDETTILFGKVLHRIEALCDFYNVKVGDKGGFIESENNLSQEGTCWVYNNAKVLGRAIVIGNAEVYSNAIVHDNAKVYDNARVYGNANVHDDSEVCGNAKVYGDALVFGNARVCGNARVFDYAKVCGNARVFDYAKVYGDARVCGNARVSSDRDYIVFKNWWSSGRYFTWTRSNNMWSVGCFYGTGEQLIEKAYRDSEESGREYERVVNYVKSFL